MEKKVCEAWSEDLRGGRLIQFINGKMRKVYMAKTLAIIVRDDEDIEWQFYRKSFKKARWRKAGQRQLNDFFLKIPAPKGIIWIK